MSIRLLRRNLGLVLVLSCLGAVAIYGVMVQVTLAQLQSLSGLVPLDMRPMGYRGDAVRALFEALGAPGRAYYLTRQIPLDLVYPALMGLSLVTANMWFGVRLGQGRFLRFASVVAGLAALADYLENLGIVVMIQCWPEVPSAVIRLSSSATIAKSGLTTVAVLCTLYVILRWAISALRRGVCRQA
ncbi:hypothetical protein NBRC116601_04390 [Cognatishimia sp. WU-CL00825]|uniref:hypothetical protein n=1 Tax=Cognatishimia sp. WU-CL00825 TaxID=3127658 RepID=UPI00310B4647